MKKQFLYVLLCLISTLQALAQNDTNKAEQKAEQFATITIAVVNSNRPYHIAFVKYFDANGDILLNTSEEFKIEISKSPRFATGSVRKTIPIYEKAKTIEVTVSNSTNMHENTYFISDLPASNNEITFVFQGAFEDVIAVEFEGVLKEKPCTFLIKGENTNAFFYADHSNARKILKDEARIKDINVEVSQTSLYKYKILGIERDKKTNTVKVKVEPPKEEDDEPQKKGKK